MVHFPQSRPGAFPTAISLADSSCSWLPHKKSEHRPRFKPQCLVLTIQPNAFPLPHFIQALRASSTVPSPTRFGPLVFPGRFRCFPLLFPALVLIRWGRRLRFLLDRWPPPILREFSAPGRTKTSVLNGSPFSPGPFPLSGPPLQGFHPLFT